MEIGSYIPFFGMKKKAITEVERQKLKDLYTKQELDLMLKKADELKSEVNTYSELPTTTYSNGETVSNGDIAFVKNSSGVFLLSTRKPSGIYRYENNKWLLANDYNLLIAEINKKVDKVPGKVLSENSYTDIDKNKLDKLIYTKVEADNLLNTKSDTNHSHSQYEPKISTKNSGFNLEKTSNAIDRDDLVFTAKGGKFLKDEIDKKLEISNVNDMLVRQVHDVYGQMYLLNGHGYQFLFNTNDYFYLKTLGGTKHTKLEITYGNDNTLTTFSKEYPTLNTGWELNNIIKRTDQNSVSIRITNFTDKKVIEIDFVTDGNRKLRIFRSSVRDFTSDGSKITKTVSISNASGNSATIGTLAGVTFNLTYDVGGEGSKVRIKTNKKMVWNGVFSSYTTATSALTQFVVAPTGNGGYDAVVGQKYVTNNGCVYGSMTGGSNDTSTQMFNVAITTDNSWTKQTVIITHIGGE